MSANKMTQTTSIETIGGKLLTVIYHGDITSVLGRRYVTLDSGVLEFFRDADCLGHIATALPALPRNPTRDDDRLLYRYMAEGIEAVYGYKDHTGEDCAISAATNLDSLEWIISKNYKISLKHTLMNGQPCDVAIDDSKGASDDQG